MILALLLSLASAQDLVDGVACVVNDDVITLSDLYDQLGDAMTEAIGQRCGGRPRTRNACVLSVEREAAEALIMRVLVRQKLQENGFDVTDAQVDGTLDSYQLELGHKTREQFKLWLRSQNVDYQEFFEQTRQDLRIQVFQQYFLRPKVNVTDDEVRAQYQRATRDMVSEDKLDLVYKAYTLPADASPEQLQAFREALQARVAAIESGEATFEDLGEVDGVAPIPMKSRYLPSQLVEAFRPVATFEVGQVGGPFELQTGFFVFRLEGREAGQVMSFDVAKDRIRAMLEEQRFNEELELWYVNAQRNASIRCTMGS